MIQLPSRWGSRTRAWKWTRSSTSRRVSRSPRSAAPTAGLVQRDARKAQRARDALREIPIDDLIAQGRQGRRALHERHAADGRRHADARRVRARAVGVSTGPARAHVPGEHEEERVRARRDAQHPRVAHARAVARRALDRQGRRAGRADQLSGAESGARSGAAVEFAGRAHALDADHPDADRPGAQAGPAGAVDAVSHGGGVLPRPASRARRSRSIRAAPTWAPRCSTPAAAV